MKQPDSQTQFVICINNDGYPASLEVRKIYPMLPDTQASEHQLIRVIDESGEDYLYPASYFAPITVPQVAMQVFAWQTDPA